MNETQQHSASPAGGISPERSNTRAGHTPKTQTIFLPGSYGCPSWGRLLSGCEQLMELSVSTQQNGAFQIDTAPGHRLGPSWLSGPIKCGSPGLCGASCRAGPRHWPNLPLEARASQVRHEVREPARTFRQDRLLLENYQRIRRLWLLITMGPCGRALTCRVVDSVACYCHLHA